MSSALSIISHHQAQKTYLTHSNALVQAVNETTFQCISMHELKLQMATGFQPVCVRETMQDVVTLSLIACGPAVLNSHILFT